MHTTAQGVLRLHAIRTESCHVTALSDLLNDAKGVDSIDRLIEAAEKRTGVEINRTARAGIYKALSGQHAKNPREETLLVWAEVFQLDVRDLRQAAAKPRGELGPWQPVAESARLDQEQRQALDLLIKAIVRGGAEDAHSPATNKVPATGPAQQPVLREVSEEFEADIAARPDPKKRRRRP